MSVGTVVLHTGSVVGNRRVTNDVRVCLCKYCYAKGEGSQQEGSVEHRRRRQGGRGLGRRGSAAAV